MKNAALVLFTLLISLQFNPAFSKEKKKSKKVIQKELEIEAAVKPYKDKAKELENKVAQLENEVDKLNNEMSVVMEENKALQNEAMQLASAPATEVSPSQSAPEGMVVFKVQLGAYNSSVTAMFNEEKFLQTEKLDGKNKYVVGFFTDYATAKQAVKDFKALGIRDAWFVPYLNGKRISDKEANSYLNFDIRAK
jgi:regulator of replication initiation timing